LVGVPVRVILHILCKYTIFAAQHLDVPVAGPSAAALAISGEKDEMRKEDETNGTLTQGIYMVQWRKYIV
jgi:hypothetical protein